MSSVKRLVYKPSPQVAATGGWSRSWSKNIQVSQSIAIIVSKERTHEQQQQRKRKLTLSLQMTATKTAKFIIDQLSPVYEDVNRLCGSSGSFNRLTPIYKEDQWILTKPWPAVWQRKQPVGSIARQTSRHCIYNMSSIIVY